MSRWRADHGDVILSGLLHTTLFLLAVALVVYEIGAVLVNSVQLDAIAQEAARSAARVAATEARHSSVEYAALVELADERNNVLEEFSYDQGAVTVRISRAPEFVITQRIPAIAERFRGEVSQTAPVAPGLLSQPVPLRGRS